MPERILVTGGTGTLGRLIVPRLRSAGCEVRAASRRSADVPVDLATGVGLAGAVAGCETILHLATGVRGLYRAMHAVDVLGTQRLLEHAGRAGVRHFLYISIVGVDQIPFGYYRAKLQAERLIQRQTAVNWSILRATQFHDLVNLYFRTLRWLPALVIPKATLCQPVDAGEVADRLCALVLGGPAGRLPDFGGPQVLGADELARAWLAATNTRRALVGLPLPGRVAAGFRAGLHTTPEHCDGQVSWQDWLARTYPGGGGGRGSLSGAGRHRSNSSAGSHSGLHQTILAPGVGLHSGPPAPRERDGNSRRVTPLGLSFTPRRSMIEGHATWNAICRCS